MICGCPFLCVVVCFFERIKTNRPGPSHVSRRLDFFEILFCHSIIDQYQIPCYMTPPFPVWLNEEVSLTYVFLQCVVLVEATES